MNQDTSLIQFHETGSFMCSPFYSKLFTTHVANYVCSSFSYFWLIIKPQRVRSSWKFWNDNQIAGAYEQLDNRSTGARAVTKKNDYTFKQMVALMRVSRV